MKGLLRPGVERIANNFRTGISEVAFVGIRKPCGRPSGQWKTLGYGRLRAVSAPVMWVTHYLIIGDLSRIVSGIWFKWKILLLNFPRKLVLFYRIF